MWDAGKASGRASRGCVGVRTPTATMRRTTSDSSPRPLRARPPFNTRAATVVKEASRGAARQGFGRPTPREPRLESPTRLCLHSSARLCLSTLRYTSTRRLLPGKDRSRRGGGQRLATRPRSASLAASAKRGMCTLACSYPSPFSRPRAETRGRWTRNVVPLPSSLSTSIAPPQSLTIW